jgi:demethylmenaquinone methyltransferase/2-methoxy-6-polyprenyl-1,4-benzoquinol methylase
VAGLALGREEIRALYRKRAENYDLTANLYYLIGFRERAFRKKAVRALDLGRGDTVVEVCCGTGLNFPLLQKRVGPEGRIIGVDLTEDMLAKARRRVEEKGWRNVELVKSDAALYEFPDGVDGIISTFAITLVPEYDSVILNGCRALKPGKRLAVLDLKMASGLASKLAPLLVLLTRPFGVTRDLEERRPWESVGRYMEDVSVEKLYLGFAYIAVGTRGGGRP